MSDRGAGRGGGGKDDGILLVGRVLNSFVKLEEMGIAGRLCLCCIFRAGNAPIWCHLSNLFPGPTSLMAARAGEGSEGDVKAPLGEADLQQGSPRT